MSGGRAEARRRKILEQGQDRLKHITLSLNSTSSGVSRSLDFSGEDLDRQSSQKPTPAASGLLPGGSSSDDREGAALRSKSWLALQESPSSSKASSPARSASGGSPGRKSSGPLQRRGSAPHSPLAPARSAALLPVSSPATAYGSDDELVTSPAGSRVVSQASGASSGTRMPAPAGAAAAAASPGKTASLGTWSAASPQPLLTPPQRDGGESPASKPRASAFAGAASPAQQLRGGKWASYDGPGAAVDAASESEPASAAKRPSRPASRAAAFTHALAATSAPRAAVAVLFAAACFFSALQLLAAAWQRATGSPPPYWAQAQRLPPLAALAGVELLIMLLAYLFMDPEHAAAAQLEAAGALALAGRAVAATAPRLHTAVSVLLPLYRQLWQDVALYVFALVLLHTFGAPEYHGNWRHVHSLAAYYSPQVPPLWRVAAARWTL